MNHIPERYADCPNIYRVCVELSKFGDNAPQALEMLKALLTAGALKDFMIEERRDGT